MDNSFDKAISKVDGLKWLPWVGDRFSSIAQENRMIIVGESHYHDQTEQSIENHNSEILTREVIEDMAMDRNYYGTKIFPNFHRALFRNDEFDAHKFWNAASFYNFVQRPMNTIKDRPTYEDFYKGWKTFFELSDLLNPGICLFIGVSAANSFEGAARDLGIHASRIQYGELISKAYPRKVEFTDKSGQKHKLVFIRHTSQMFSWSKWNDYLRSEIPTQLDWLETEIKQH